MASVSENLTKLEHDIISKAGYTTVVKRPGDGFLTQVGTFYPDVPTINVRAYAFNENSAYIHLLNEFSTAIANLPNSNLIFFVIDEMYSCNETVKQTILRFINDNRNCHNIHFILVDYE